MFSDAVSLVPYPVPRLCGGLDFFLCRVGLHKPTDKGDLEEVPDGMTAGLTHIAHTLLHLFEKLFPSVYITLISILLGFAVEDVRGGSGYWTV